MPPVAGVPEAPLPYRGRSINADGRDARHKGDLSPVLGTLIRRHPADKARHDRMVALVERMLEHNKKKHSGKLAPSELERLEREIAATDAEIDELVYELYGITEDERRIIESA